MYGKRHYGLGLAFEGKRQPELAKRAYEQFLSVWAKADTDIPEVVKARQRLEALRHP